MKINITKVKLKRKLKNNHNLTKKSRRSYKKFIQLLTEVPGYNQFLILKFKINLILLIRQVVRRIGHVFSPKGKGLPMLEI